MLYFSSHINEHSENKLKEIFSTDVPFYTHFRANVNKTMRITRRIRRIGRIDIKKIERWKLVHLILFGTGILTFGFFDGFTAMLMMEKYGISVESNPLWQGIMYSHGPVVFLLFKLFAAVMVFSVPFFLYRQGEQHWMTAGFMSVFMIGGILGAIDNYLYLRNGVVYLQPEIVLAMVLVMTLIALHIGDILDSNMEREKLFKISDKRWAELKSEIGYPSNF